jgi:cysteine desulfurase
MSLRPQPLFVDHCSTTPPLAEAVAEHNRVATTCWGNPSSPHGSGRAAARELARARATLADSIGARPDEIVLCSSGTEANNLAIQGVVRRALLRQTGLVRVVAGADSHASVLEPLRLLQREAPDRILLELLPVSGEGFYDWGWLEEGVRRWGNELVMLSVLHINNETGVVQDLGPLKHLRLGNPAMALHVDWVQSQGKWPLDLRLEVYDLLSCSAHKVHGLRGAALLYVRSGMDLEPVLVGGAQEKFRRAGTEDVAAVAAYAEAVRHIGPTAQTWAALDAIERALLHELLDGGVSFRLHGPTPPAMAPNDQHPPRRIPGVLNLAFPAVANKEDLLIALDLEGIHASATSACHSGVLSDSHVLAAMGCDARERASSIRLGFSARQTPADGRRVGQALVRIVKRAAGAGATGLERP